MIIFLKGTVNDIINVRSDLRNNKKFNGVYILKYSILIEFKDFFFYVIIIASVIDMLIKDNFKSCCNKIYFDLLKIIKGFSIKRSA